MTRIKRNVAALFLGLALVFGATGGVVVNTEEPASAHNYDNWSYWFCSKHRSGPEQTVTHSVPDYLDQNYIRYYCRQDFFGVSHQYWVQAWHPLENNISARPWAYQKCAPHGYIICSEPYSGSA